MIRNSHNKISELCCGIAFGMPSDRVSVSAVAEAQNHIPLVGHEVCLQETAEDGRLNECVPHDSNIGLEQFEMSINAAWNLYSDSMAKRQEMGVVTNKADRSGACSPHAALYTILILLSPPTKHEVALSAVE